MREGIECNCFVIDKTIDDLGLDQEDFKIKCKFDKDSIYSIRETLNEDGEVDITISIVYFKSGDSLLVDINYNELDKLIYG